MLIPKYHRKLLNRIGRSHWFWRKIHDWAFGERYKFMNGDVAYLFKDEIITIRRGGYALWKKEDINA